MTKSKFTTTNTIDGRGTVLCQGDTGYTGMTIIRSAMSCCGMATIQGFGALRLNGFADKAQLCSVLYLQNYSPRQYMFIVNKAQSGRSNAHYKDSTFALFEELGAELIATRDNHNMGTKQSLFIYILDIKKAVGKYIRADGTPLEKEPKPAEPKAPIEEMAAAIAATPAKRAKTVKAKHPDGGIVEIPPVSPAVQPQS